MTIAQRLGAINARLDHTTKCNEFFALARAIMLSKGSHGHARHIAREGGVSPAVQAALDSGFPVYDHDYRAQKAAVTAGSTTDAQS